MGGMIFLQAEERSQASVLPPCLDKPFLAKAGEDPIWDQHQKAKPTNHGQPLRVQKNKGDLLLVMFLPFYREKNDSITYPSKVGGETLGYLII